MPGRLSQVSSPAAGFIQVARTGAGPLHINTPAHPLTLSLAREGIQSPLTGLPLPPQSGRRCARPDGPAPWVCLRGKPCGTAPPSVVRPPRCPCPLNPPLFDAWHKPAGPEGSLRCRARPFALALLACAAASARPHPPQPARALYASRRLQRAEATGRTTEDES